LIRRVSRDRRYVEPEKIADAPVTIKLNFACCQISALKQSADFSIFSSNEQELKRAPGKGVLHFMTGFQE
jgi:hypothetical protein